MIKTTLLLLVLTAGLAAADPQFAVATVKVNDHSDPRMGSGPSVKNGNFMAGNLTLKVLVSYAFEIAEFQIKGPAWIETTHFDVAAKMPEGASDAQARVMLRTLLEERFHLKTHRDSTEMNNYALVVGKGGAKIKELRDGEAIPPPHFPPGASALMTNGTLEAFAGQLALKVGQPVLNKTGMSGKFHIFVTFAPTGAAPTGDPDSNPDLFTAIQEQLGLKLESQKGPVVTLVIDSAEKTPEEN